MFLVTCTVYVLQAPRRRTNRERTESTKSALLVAARRLFVEKGFAATGTPEIVAMAGLTRGALYHHFPGGKDDIFRAVVEAEAAAVAAEIEAATPHTLDPLVALGEGGDAYFAAMAIDGRTRLLLLEGPAILGRAAMDEIDSRHGGRTLRDGLGMAMEAGAIRHLPLDALSTLLSAVFERAALALGTGGDPEAYREVVATIVTALAVPGHDA